VQPVKRSHQIYARVRPLLMKLGILTIARWLFGSDLRERIAVRLGLMEFDQTRTSMSSQTNVNPQLREWMIARVQRFESQRLTLDGVNLIGDLRADLGIGESFRLIRRALECAHIPAQYHEVPLRFQSRTTPLPAIEQGYANSFSLFHMNAPEFYEALTLVPQASFENKYLISFWYWEVPKFPNRWHMMTRYLDELWVASRYTQSILSAISPIPVVRIPLPIAVEVSGAGRDRFNLPEDRFVFLFSFNPGSAVIRKNPFGFIEAFRRAFGAPKSGPLLVLKVQHLDSHYGEGLEKPLREAVESVGGILLTDNLSRLEMNDLLNVSDCYVSLHRSEGFGLGMAEAMSLGKPVIATAYSGNMDYTTPDNSLLIGYTLRNITDDEHYLQPFFRELYTPGQVWAEPDVDHAAALMTQVYEDPQWAREIGAKAQQYIAQHHGERAVGEMIRARLEMIVHHHDGTVEADRYRL
jgi:glycosyltransferase involved in cell wall biosynthesis